MASISSTSSFITPAFALGIDFGTTFCCVAVLRHPTKKPEVLPSSYSTNTTPSYVAYNDDSDSDRNSDDGSDDDNGGVYVGETAKQEAYDNPEKTIFDIKRLIGCAFSNLNIQKYKQFWPFHLVNMTGNVGVQIGDEEKLPQEIASELLRHLRNTSEDFLQSAIDCAVVTIPVYYSEIQKGLTEWACHAAGFKYIHFIAEPVAAAVAYGIKSSFQSHKTKTCLIYDLGGGTFDVTVFRLDAKNRVEVIATGGDDRLGGEDFNDLITEFCLNEFKRIHGVDLAEGKTSGDAEVCKQTARKLRRIRNECEVKKCYLSSATLTSVVVSLDNIYENFNLLVTVTRSKLEELIFLLLNRSMKILDETLQKSGCAKEEIDDVIIVSGSSRIPKVQQIVQEYFAGKQIRRTIDADKAVTCGAAVHAYNVFKGNGAPFSVVTLLKETQQRPQSLESAFSLQIFSAAPLSKTIRWGKKINGFPPRKEHAVVAVGHLIYCFGGVNYSGDPGYSRDALDVFVLNLDEQDKEWEKLAVENSEVNPNARLGHSAVAHKEFVLIFGGYNAKKEKTSNSTYRFNTQTLRWEKLKVTVNTPSGIPPSLRYGHSATVHDDRFILIFGGFDWTEQRKLNTISSFDMNNKTWTAVKTRGTLPSRRMNHCAFVHNERMYIFGGSHHFPI